MKGSFDKLIDLCPQSRPAHNPPLILLIRNGRLLYEMSFLRTLGGIRKHFRFVPLLIRDVGVILIKRINPMTSNDQILNLKDPIPVHPSSTSSP